MSNSLEWENRYLNLTALLFSFIFLLLFSNSQSHPTLCGPTDGSRQAPLWDSPDKNTGVGCSFLLQRIFPTQESRSVSYVSCIGRWVLYHCHPLGSSRSLLFSFGYSGSPLPHTGFPELRRVEAALHRGAQASHRGGVSPRGAQAPQVRCAGLAALRRVQSSLTRGDPCALHSQAEPYPLFYPGSPFQVILPCRDEA